MPKPKMTQSQVPSIVAPLKHIDVEKLVNKREESVFVRLELFEDSPLEGDHNCDGLYALRTDGKWIDFSKFRSSPDVRGASPEPVTPDQRLQCGVNLGDQVALQLLPDLERFAGNL